MHHNGIFDVVITFFGYCDMKNLIMMQNPMGFWPFMIGYVDRVMLTQNFVFVPKMPGNLSTPLGLGYIDGF